MRSIFIILFAVLSSTVLLAQKRSTRIGLQSGMSVNVASIAQGSTIDKNSFVFFAPSLVTSIHLGKVLAINPGVGYNPLGFRRNVIVDSALTLFLSNRVNNINIPLNVSANLKAGKGRLFVNLGPSITFGIDGLTTVDSIIGGLRNTSTKPFDFGGASAEIKRVNLGSSFGLGYWFPSGFELKTNYGFLNDITKTSLYQLDNVIVNVSGSFYFLGNRKFWKYYKKD